MVVPNGNNILMDTIFQYMNIKFSFLYCDGLKYWTWPNQTKENIYYFFYHTNEHIHSCLMATRCEAHHLAAVTDMQTLEKKTANFHQFNYSCFSWQGKRRAKCTTKRRGKEGEVWDHNVPESLLPFPSQKTVPRFLYKRSLCMAYKITHWIVDRNKKQHIYD